jgi:FeS assembly protein SufD
MEPKRSGLAEEMDSFLPKDAVEALSRERNEPPWLAEKRLQAWEAARGMPAPGYLRQTYEERPFWSYLITDRRKGAVSLGDVLAPLSGDLPGRMSLTGGRGVAFQTFHEALVEREDLVREYFMTRGVRAEENLFAAIHGAAFDSGAVVHVPANHCSEEPLILDAAMEGAAHFDHILIVAEPNSRLTFVDTMRSSNSLEKGYRSGMVEIFAKDGAQVSYVGVQDLPQEVTCFTHKRAVVGRDANVSWLDISLGGSHVKSDVTNLMVGPGGHAEIRGAFMGDGEQLFEISTVTIHEAPMSTGTMFIRGALRDEARSTYRGLIRIKENAHGVNSNQEEDTILLSEGARADAIPTLEIDNNDVRCGHSAHVGELDKERLFYIATRGLGEVDARLVVVDGFLEPLIRDVPDSTLREALREEVRRRVAA